MDKLQEAYKNWKRIATKEDIKAVKNYVCTVFSRKHRKINMALRLETGLCKVDIEALHNALQKAVIPCDIIVVREGNRKILCDNDMSDMAWRDIIGNEIVEKGFLSTTYAKSSCIFKGNIHYTIKVPAGAVGLFVAPLSGILFWENEVLFDYGQRLKIEDIIIKRKYWDVRASLVV